MITVDLEKRDYSRHNRTGRPAYLVRGLGKRAIRVIFNFSSYGKSVNDELLAIMAAKHAVKRGWKNIEVHDDSLFAEGEYPFAFNKSQARGRRGSWGPEVWGIWLGMTFKDMWDFMYLENGDIVPLEIDPPGQRGYDWDRYSCYDGYEDLGYLDILNDNVEHQ